MAISPGDTLDIILDAEVDALTEPAVEEEPMQAPAELVLPQAADALNDVSDIENFLSGEDYEYTKVVSGFKTTIILKLEDGNSMAILYDENEFDALESSYDKDGSHGYKDVMNNFVKDSIKSGGDSEIHRHKGSKVVAK